MVEPIEREGSGDAMTSAFGLNVLSMEKSWWPCAKSTIGMKKGGSGPSLHNLYLLCFLDPFL